MNTQEQKKYHTRKLAIIEMIYNCDLAINNQRNFLSCGINGLALKNTYKNIARYERIKNYLKQRYNN